MVATLNVVRSVIRRNFQVRNPDKFDYKEIVTFQALVKLALQTKSAEDIKWTEDRLNGFLAGNYQQLMGAYNFYNIGGAAAAQMIQNGYLGQYRQLLKDTADKLLENAPRSTQGMIASEKYCDKDQIWIDMVFAVCPFLLFTGLACGEEQYLNEAVEQIRIMHSVFWNEQTQLYHQCLNFRGPGKLSEDHWSRGNGWGILAMAELVRYLPAGARRDEMDAYLLRHIKGCLKVQDENGMWHQEMSDHTSYVETSGTGLILYAIGVSLLRGIADEGWREKFIAGLEGYLSYITLNGSIHNCCTGCLCPGDGSKEAYKANKWILNDPHAFGPAGLAFGVAAELGISDVEPF